MQIRQCPPRNRIMDKIIRCALLSDIACLIVLYQYKTVKVITFNRPEVIRITGGYCIEVSQPKMNTIIYLQRPSVQSFDRSAHRNSASTISPRIVSYPF